MILLITGACRLTSAQYNELLALGFSVALMPNEQDALPIPYEMVEGVICNGLFLYHPIDRFVNLKYIQLTSAGYDRVPVDYVNEHGIQLFNAKGVYSVPIAEFAVASLLQFYKQTRYFAEGQNMHAWRKHRGLLELSGKTVCIVGCGDIGTECAKRFTAFGCKVIGVNRTACARPYFDRIEQLSALEDVVPSADVVVLSIALTEQTHHLINRQVFKKMKDGCVLVNVARGQIVDTDAMMIELNSGRIFAALDVFEEEPLHGDHPLWSLQNVLITPHNSFVGDVNSQRLWDIVYNNLKDHRSKR